MASYVCLNCDDSDLREDFEHGDIVCINCGCCAASIICDVPSFGDVCANGALAAGATRAALHAYEAFAGSKSAPYQRKTYFNERISQWQCNEPAIPEDDELTIMETWNQWAPVTWPDDYHRASATTKERIGHMLEFIDLQRRRNNLKPYFKTKYLEKWISIRGWFCTARSTADFVDDEDIAWIKQQFLRVERVFNQAIRGRQGRRSLINYNFVMRRLLELRGCAYATSDWPPLKTVSKQRALVAMWRIVCAYLDWPYINTDALVFPTIVRE